MTGFKPSCRIRPNVLGDWQIMPPAGRIIQIGDAGGPVSPVILGPDDLNASGKVEVAGALFVKGVTGARNAIEMLDDLGFEPGAELHLWGVHDELVRWVYVTEEMTIAVGDGSSGEWGTEEMCPWDAIMLGVVTRITQAPGGGATKISVGRWDPGNYDEFLDAGPVTLGSTSDSATDGDGDNAGPVYNDVGTVILYMTDNDVTISPLKICTTSFCLQLYAPES